MKKSLIHLAVLAALDSSQPPVMFGTPESPLQQKRDYLGWWHWLVLQA